MDSGLSEIASVLEWGFGELRWGLQQQTELLRSIDQTLRTPSETKANEWRLHAEELRRRGVLDESEEFFLKALNEYRLDYRIYVGLAETYLQMGKFDEARNQLERSLPHAPKKEIDYKSYSYRLIGHIYECKEDFAHATESLRNAIALSPDYVDALYDFAQYSSMVNDSVVDQISFNTFKSWGGNWASRDYNVVRWLCLHKAIAEKPMYFYLAKRERNFEPHRADVEASLSNLSENVRGKIEADLSYINLVSGEVETAISSAREALNKANSDGTLECAKLWKEGKDELSRANAKRNSEDYLTLLDTKSISESAREFTDAARKKAVDERIRYRRVREEKVTNAWKKVPSALVGYPLLGGLIGGMIGCTIGWKGPAMDAGFYEGFLLGALVTFLFGIFTVSKQLK
ncbi:MAG: tetratricopeptide repeat protein [Thaumarchaeota archaeon]|nr:tetratricopeptide repeat protein [Nitrososphaerota archaeon]